MTDQQTIPMTERPTNLTHPENKNITVHIPVEDFVKLRAYVEQVNTEISGYARVESLEGGHFKVSNFKIFDQINSPGHTEMYEKSISKYILEGIKNDVDVNKELKCWWHSHCKMGTFWSGIDEKQIEDHDSKMEEDNWKLSLETNHAGVLIARIDVYYPARYTVAGLTVKVDYAEDEVFEAAKKEIDELCNEYKYTPPVVVGGVKKKSDRPSGSGKLETLGARAGDDRTKKQRNSDNNTKSDTDELDGGDRGEGLEQEPLSSSEEKCDDCRRGSGGNIDGGLREGNGGVQQGPLRGYPEQPTAPTPPRQSEFGVDAPKHPRSSSSEGDSRDVGSSESRPEESNVDLATRDGRLEGEPYYKWNDEWIILFMAGSLAFTFGLYQYLRFLFS